MKDKVVSFHYILKNEEGETLEASRPGEPFSCLHGRRQIVEGLERALNGKRVGERVTVTVPPELGCGLRQEGLVLSVPKSQLPQDKEFTVGEMIELRYSTQHPISAKILEVKDDEIVADANHPFAGKTLVFDVEITAIRSATRQELEHGHAHAHGACGH